MRISFSTRLITSIVIIELAMLGLLVWNNVRIINHSYNDLLTSSSREQSALLASAIAPGLVAYDIALIEDALSLIKEKHDLVYAEVFDMNSRRVAVIGNPPDTDIKLRSEKYQEIIGENLLHIFRTVKVEKQTVGSLRVGYSTILLKKTVNEIIWQNLIISLITLLSLIAATVIISIMLTSKLRKIQYGVEQIEKGNLGYEIQVKKNDELGELGHTLNNMARHLNSVQQQLISEQAKLESRVTERTGALQQSNKTLKNTIEELNRTQAQLIETEKLASLGGVVAGVAHEINTPLGVGITAATTIEHDLLKLKKSLQSDTMTQVQFENYIEKTANICELLNGSLRSSAALINSFKQLAVEQSNTDWREINLCEYINEITTSLRATLTQHRVTMENLCDVNLIIYTSPGVLYQIFNTLIANSITHAFEHQPGKITIATRQNNNSITIEFQDYGKGISQADLPLIFEPFFTTRKGNRDNSGLGLSIIYNLISRTLQGHIKAESTVGKGTVFYIELPVVSQ